MSHYTYRIDNHDVRNFRATVRDYAGVDLYTVVGDQVEQHGMISAADLDGLTRHLVNTGRIPSGSTIEFYGAA